MSASTKDANVGSPDAEHVDMQAEYHIDYTQAKPNRFAEHMPSGGRLIILEPDIAQAFPTNESVNTLLRAILKAIPPGGPSSAPPRT